MWKLLFAGVVSNILPQDPKRWLVVLFAVLFTLCEGIPAEEDDVYPHCKKAADDVPNADAVPSHQMADAVMT